MEEELINKVANSSLITIDLEKYYPENEIDSFDIKDFLFHELILKEKDYRQALKEHDWTKYDGKILCVHCSTDAIIPVWSYMLVAIHAKDHAVIIFTGSKEDYLTHYYHEFINRIDEAQYQDQKVVIKGCSDKNIPASAYADIALKLSGIAQSIMYGEPCSTVPVYKRPRLV